MKVSMNFAWSGGGVPHRGRSLYVNSSTPVNHKFSFCENFLLSELLRNAFCPESLIF
jgi:hypothetical protein